MGRKFTMPQTRLRVGKITRNPYFNFLRVVRKENFGLTIIEVARLGAEKWRNMSVVEKCPFYMQALFANRPIRKKKIKLRFLQTDPNIRRFTKK